jgi:glucose-6-phosphate 1-dehydrogenase
MQLGVIGLRKSAGTIMTEPKSVALVLFGATGDLAHKKTFGSLYAMVRRGRLKEPVIGVASRD